MYRGQDADSPVELESQFILRLPPVSGRRKENPQKLHLHIYYRIQPKLFEKLSKMAVH